MPDRVSFQGSGVPSIVSTAVVGVARTSGSVTVPDGSRTNAKTESPAAV